MKAFCVWFCYCVWIHVINIDVDDIGLDMMVLAHSWTRAHRQARVKEKTKFGMVIVHDCHPSQRVEENGVGKDGVEVEALRTD